jgi:uncharacterized protein (TIGR02058 family)
MGSSLRRGDYTQAAVRALKDALWHNSLSMAEAFGFAKEAMIVDVEIAVQHPDQVDTATVKAVLPYGTGTVTVTHGGLDITKPTRNRAAGTSDKTIIAHAAVLVSFDMERQTSAPTTAGARI